MSLELFSTIIDSSRIIQQDVQSVYGAVTTGYTKRISGALKPVNSDEIHQIVNLCRQHNIKIYPISSGRNWGYSDSMPADHDHIILDLSLMTGITDYNVDTGIITVEPGVTQKQLYDFLKNQGSKHVVSVTGSSPDASIIGNYLERGFGLLPVMDHALSVLSLTAILGDGSRYTSLFQSLGADKSAQSFRWGIGPYTDGLFFQSGIGIVTSMMIKLSATADSIGACLIEVRDRQMLTESLAHLKNLRESWGLESLQIKILNSYYSFASMGVKQDEILKAGSIKTVCQKYDVPTYTLMITFSGHPKLTKALEKHLKKTFKFCCRVRVLNDRLVKIAKTAKSFLPAALKVKISVLEGLWDLLQGMPGTMMIGRIPYYRIADDSHLEKLNPAKDHCGILWFALALPFADQSISDFEELGAYAKTQYGFDPIMNFTNYSQAGLIGLYAIVFDQKTESETARECYMTLLHQAQKNGYFPYRLPLFAAEEFFKNPSDDNLNKRIKELLDPQNIFTRPC